MLNNNLLIFLLAKLLRVAKKAKSNDCNKPMKRLGIKCKSIIKSFAVF